MEEKPVLLHDPSTRERPTKIKIKSKVKTALKWVSIVVVAYLVMGACSSTLNLGALGDPVPEKSKAESKTIDVVSGKPLVEFEHDPTYIWRQNLHENSAAYRAALGKVGPEFKDPKFLKGALTVCTAYGAGQYGPVFVRIVTEAFSGSAAPKVSPAEAKAIFFATRTHVCPELAAKAQSEQAARNQAAVLKAQEAKAAEDAEARRVAEQKAAAQAAPRVQAPSAMEFVNCKHLRDTYPNGVQKGQSDGVYEANDGLDRDGDGTACETSG